MWLRKEKQSPLFNDKSQRGSSWKTLLYGGISRDLRAICLPARAPMNYRENDDFIGESVFVECSDVNSPFLAFTPRTIAVSIQI